MSDDETYSRASLLPPPVVRENGAGNSTLPPGPTLDENTLRAWLTLANAALSARPFTALLEHFHWQPQAVLAASDDQIAEVSSIQARQMVRLRDSVNAPTERQMAWLTNGHCRLVVLNDAAYPRLLREIHDPPPLLFVCGSLMETDRFSIGIVGSRHATPYGRAVAEQMAHELAAHGLTVVSGGAIGIDTAAHRGAVRAGRTLAVLGCGLDVDYPRQNREMFAQIAACGALISEYPPGAQPEAWRFPARNRVISGLSQGILVVEAPASSGALNTARHAVEQGRTLMAVPGNIDRPASVGTNNLLKDGASPITEVQDILYSLNMVVMPARAEHQHTLALEMPSGAGIEAVNLPPDTVLLPASAAEMGAEIPGRNERKERDDAGAGRLSAAGGRTRTTSNGTTPSEPARSGKSRHRPSSAPTRPAEPISSSGEFRYALPETRLRPAAAPAPDKLTALQLSLMDALSLTPCHLDTLAQRAGLSSMEAGREIVMLELGGHVQRLPGNHYIRLL